MSIIVYNIEALPSTMTVEDMLEIYYSTKVIIYEGNKVPFVVDQENLDMDIVIVDNKEYNVGDKVYES